MRGAGALEQEASGTLELGGYITVERDVYAYGTTRVEGGQIAQPGASRWHNHGTIELAGQSFWSNAYGRNQLLNRGLIVKEPGEWTTSLPNTFNDGTIRVPDGRSSFYWLQQTSDGRS